MIRLMVVDDEAGIRKGLLHYVDWSTWDIDLVAEAGDGDEAYARAIQTRPDVLLSDIRMPGRSGLELARDLAQVLPSLRVILLTGYSDTEYLQAALKIGVKDYLLKPAGAEKIIEAVLKVKKEILAERSQRQESISKDALLNEGIPVLQMHLMSDVVQGRLASNDAILNKARRLKIPLEAAWLQLALLRTGESEASQYRSENEQAMDSWQLSQTLNLVLEKHPGSFFVEMEPDLILLVLGADTEAELKRSFLRLAEELSSTLGEKPYAALAIGIGSVVTAVSDLPRSYASAHSALSRWAWETQTRIFTEPISPNITHLQSARRWKKEATQAITREQSQEVLASFEAMFAAYKEARADIEEVRESCRQLLDLAVNCIQGGSQAELSEELSADMSHLDAMLDAEKMRAWMCERLARLCQGQHQSLSPLVRKAQNYIREKHAENITLQSLAPELFVSPNYLGRIFREQTGYKLGDWLNKYRVEKAKELLDNPEMKTYDVADRVGFSSYKYFSVCFLKYAGCSAREYRERRGE